MFNCVRALGYISYVKVISVILELVYCVVNLGSRLFDGSTQFLDGVCNKIRNSSILKAQIFCVFSQGRGFVCCG